jgi:hypothetical protein
MKWFQLRSGSFAGYPFYSTLLFFGAVVCGALWPRVTSGFSLLGPYADWMVETNGYRQPGDIGGPMAIGEGYRWNVPLVTYGFDKSFIDYFGSNGVAAVETAIQALNDLAPASSIELTNYPLATLRVNYQAQAQGLYDLKSAALSVLLEEVGLGQPVRNVYALRQWNPLLLAHPMSYDWFSWAVPDWVVQRNLDPQTAAATVYVNGILFDGMAAVDPSGFQDVFEVAVDPDSEFAAPVAETGVSSWDSLSMGYLFAGLTQDDVGGLGYLWGATNVKFELLLPGVQGTGSNATNFVNGARRPGVEKVIFVPHSWDDASARFLPMTNIFTDRYFTNDTLTQQQLQRVISRPDVLFSAADIGEGVWWPPLLTRTGTTNWFNNAALNGNPGGAGPGVIPPPIEITFRKLGPVVQTFGTQPPAGFLGWGSFDLSTNSPVSYPTLNAKGTNAMAVRLWLLFPGQGSFLSFADPTWVLPTYVANASLETSTNLVDWVPLTTVTNRGAKIDWFHWTSGYVRQFFRVVPQ